jgi:hypothetical protein
MKWPLLLLIAASPICMHAQDPPVTPTVVKMTLCEIKAHPEKFQHAYVEFTAVATHGFEDSMVEDRDCLWAVSKNPGVWMEFGGTASTATMYCCGVSANSSRPKQLTVDDIELPLVNDDMFKNFDARLHPKHGPTKDSDAVRATLRGTIFARQGKQSWQPAWGGYGHMGCCILFVVQQVTFVDPQRITREWGR